VSRANVWLAAAALLVASCGEDPSTPHRTFDALRHALLTSDGQAVTSILDSESMWYRRGLIREWRALADRGDTISPEKGIPLSAAELTQGTDDDAIALLLQRNFALFRDSKWYLEAAVAEEVPDGDDAMCFKLRGRDGAERDVWFLREGGRWRYDDYRTRQLQ
jgi:hypothetical protein